VAAASCYEQLWDGKCIFHTSSIVRAGGNEYESIAGKSGTVRGVPALRADVFAEQDGEIEARADQDKGGRGLGAGEVFPRNLQTL